MKRSNVSRHEESEDEDEIWTLKPKKKTVPKKDPVSKTVRARATTSKECKVTRKSQSLQSKPKLNSNIKKQDKQGIGNILSPRPNKPVYEGFCPFCQMPFSILSFGSPGSHVSQCVDCPLNAEKECPQGIHCDNTIDSHFRRFLHSSLAVKRSGIQDNGQHDTGDAKRSKEDHNTHCKPGKQEQTKNTKAIAAPKMRKDAAQTSKSKLSGKREKMIVKLPFGSIVNFDAKPEVGTPKDPETPVDIAKRKLCFSNSKDNGAEIPETRTDESLDITAAVLLQDDEDKADALVDQAKRKLRFPGNSPLLATSPLGGKMKFPEQLVVKTEIKASPSKYCDNVRPVPCIVIQPVDDDCEGKVRGVGGQERMMKESQGLKELNQEVEELSGLVKEEIESLETQGDSVYGSVVSENDPDTENDSDSGNAENREEDNGDQGGERERNIKWEEDDSELNDIDKDRKEKDTKEDGIKDDKKTEEEESQFSGDEDWVSQVQTVSQTISPAKNPTPVLHGRKFSPRKKAIVQLQGQTSISSFFSAKGQKRKIETQTGEDNSQKSLTVPKPAPTKSWPNLKQASNSMRASVPSKSFNTQEDKSGGWNKSCPFYKKIPGTPFTVDAFRYGTIPGCKAYFLSHFHYDHYMGLRKSFSHPLYCSKVTLNLVRKKINVSDKYLHPLPLNVPIMVEGVEVTLLEANHCPGAVLFLFRLADGRVMLHTGDFRASQAMEEYPVLAAKPHIDTLYLDTTYCDPSHSFPPQQDVMNMAVTLATDFLRDNPNGLIVVGSYTIGKERIFLAIAESLNCKVCVTREKKGILDCLEDKNITSRLTLNGHEARVHVMKMGQLRAEELQSYLGKYKSRYNAVLAIEPTGWTHSKRTPSLHNIRPKYTRENITIYGLPYSEHSSYTEMKRFTQFTRPDKVLPTVNNGNPTSRKKMEELFKSWLTENSASPKMKQSALKGWLK